MRSLLAALLLSAAPLGVQAQEGKPLAPVTITEWKAVYGQIETKDRIAARARIGGTVTELDVTEGDTVTAGQKIATVVDEKIQFQLNAIDAQIKAYQAQLENAQTELTRGKDLMSRGVSTNQQVDALQTQVDVLTNQIASGDAQRRVIIEQAAEGDVLAPIAGKVLDVPVTKDAVIQPGEAVATLGGGGFFLRLAVPERFATTLKQGAPIDIESTAGATVGKLAKIYPLIQNGRVTADVEVSDLPDSFVDARVLVRLPVGTRDALMVPAAAIETRAGLDFVTVTRQGASELRTVVPGEHQTIDGVDMVEILSGLSAGDAVALK
ncbi:MAG: efflux RND transporter periplasmic adaptor subunit [Rhodobacteraceae bacterium]|nr:efflux RND transporter periplasmic adaptor subunit [Paracoccaceae bacterium]